MKSLLLLSILTVIGLFSLYAGVIQDLNLSLLKDREKALAAIQKDSNAFEYIDEALKKDRTFVFEALQYEDVTSEMDETLQRDSSFIFAVINTYGYGLEYATKEQRANRALVLKSISEQSFAWEYADEVLKHDRAFILTALSENGWVLDDLNETEQRDREFILTALSQNGWVIQVVQPLFNIDREVAATALLENGLALEFMDENLTQDKALVELAVWEDNTAFQYAHPSLKKDKAFVKKLLKVARGSVLMVYADEPLKNDPELRALIKEESDASHKESLGTSRQSSKRNHYYLDATHKFGLEAIDCDINTTLYDTLTGLECYDMHVPEIYNGKTDRIITFPVRIYRSTASDAAKKPPVIHLGAGGPGANMGLDSDYVVENILMEHQSFSIEQNRDLIVIDPRCSGLSEPLLVCDEYVFDFLDNLSRSTTIAELHNNVNHSYADCIERLRQNGVNFNGYNSLAIVTDVEMLRQALGIERWTLFGVSYSTIYAQLFAKLYPQHVEKMILDSTTFLHIKMDNDYVGRTMKSYHALYNYQNNIAKNDTNITIPSIDAQKEIWRLFAKLNKNPIPANNLSLKLDGFTFVAALLEGVYYEEVFSDLPQIISELDANQTDTFALYFNKYLNFQLDKDYGDIAMMAHYCYEDKAFIDFKQVRKL